MRIRLKQGNKGIVGLFAILVLVLSVGIAGVSIVRAQVSGTTFFTALGDIVFPFSPPNQSTSAPGTIDNMAIGSTTPAAVTALPLHVDDGTKTATATSGAATLNKNAGVITSESLTTAAGADYTLTLTDSDIAATDQVFASVSLGTATTGTPVIATVKPSAGSLVIVVQNIAASAALNGTIKIAFMRLAN